MAREVNTMTAPRAIIKKNGKAIGYIRNFRTTENISRGRVVGLGRLTPRELPALGWTGTWSCDFYLIDLKKSGIPDLDPRQVNSVEQYSDSLKLSGDIVDIYVYKEEAITTGVLITDKQESSFAVIRNVHLNASNWDITENNISAKNQSGEYTDPIILPI